MTNNNHKDEITTIVQEAISELTNVEPNDIALNDNFEEDLFLDLDVDLPKIIINLNKRLNLDIDGATIDDFLNEAHQDEAKATVAELVALIKEENDFN